MRGFNRVSASSIGSCSSRENSQFTTPLVPYRYSTPQCSECVNCRVNNAACAGKLVPAPTHDIRSRGEQQLPFALEKLIVKLRSAEALNGHLGLLNGASGQPRGPESSARIL